MTVQLGFHDSNRNLFASAEFEREIQMNEIRAYLKANLRVTVLVVTMIVDRAHFLRQYSFHGLQSPFTD